MPTDDEKMLAEALEFLLDPWSGRGYSQTKDKDAIVNAKSAIAAYKSHIATQTTTNPTEGETKCLRCGRSEAAHNMMGADDVPYRDQDGCRYISSRGVDALESTLATVRAELAEMRATLRNAWAKLECRCIFNKQNEKVAEDPKCPYHGFDQRSPNEWMPIADLRVELAEAVRERDEQESWKKAANAEAALWLAAVVEREAELTSTRARLEAWHKAMTDVSVINWTLSEDNAEDLHKQLMAVIAQNVQEQLDPLVSRQAADLADALARLEVAEGKERDMARRLQGMADEVDSEHELAYVTERLGDLIHNARVALTEAPQ